jgi:hypothetical protein
MIQFGVAKNKKILTGEDIAVSVQQFRYADSANRRDRLRYARNHVLYAPNDDWETCDATMAATLLAEGRPPGYYNMMQMYVEGNAGNFMANKVDPEFADNQSDNADTTGALIALKHAFYADKNHFKYNAEHLSAIVNGCIGIGIEEIRIVRSLDEPRGRIVFKSLPSTSVIFVPNNLTDNISRGSRDAWKRFYLTPKLMCSYFEDMTPEVRSKLLFMKKDDPVYEGRGTEYPIERFWGGQYEVVEHYHIEIENAYIAFDSTNSLRLPSTPYEFGSEEDWLAKSFWAESQGITLDPSSIKELVIPTETLWITTFCPDLGIVFENRKDERQIYNFEGKIKLPFHTWAYITKNGKCTSLVDLGKNMQNDINLREYHKTKMFTKTPIGGKTYIHPMAYGDDDRKFQDLVRDFTDPSIPVKLDADSPPNTRLIWTESGSQINPAIFADEQSKMSMMDRILRLPLAMQGIGKSGTSGILFGRQVIEGNMMQKVPATTLENYEHDKYESWVNLAIKLYGGETQQEIEYNYNRTFINNDTKEKIILNEFVGIDETGKDIVINKVSNLKNVQVIISQSKDNDYMKQAHREVDIAYLTAMPPSPTNMGYRAIAEADLAKNLDGITPQQKDDIDEMATLAINLSKKQLVFQTAQIEAQMMQLEQSAKQQAEMQQMQQSMPPIDINQPATGTPVESQQPVI